MQLVAARVTYIHSPDGAFQWWYKRANRLIIVPSFKCKTTIKFCPVKVVKRKSQAEKQTISYSNTQEVKFEACTVCSMYVCIWYLSHLTRLFIERERTMFSELNRVHLPSLLYSTLLCAYFSGDFGKLPLRENHCSNCFLTRTFRLIMTQVLAMILSLSSWFWPNLMQWL